MVSGQTVLVNWDHHVLVVVVGNSRGVSVEEVTEARNVVASGVIAVRLKG